MTTKATREQADPVDDAPPETVGRLYIDGVWRGGHSSVADVDPSTGAGFATIAQSSAADVEVAVAAARRAFASWAAVSAGQRGRILRDAAELLASDLEGWADLLAQEMGKPVREAHGECARACAILRYFAGESERPFGEHYASQDPRTWLFTRREPVGVVGVITPWNFPAAIPTWKLAPALVFGNTIVVKLAGDAPLSALRLVSALDSVGLPPGVLNVVLGPGATVGDALVNHPGVDAITFTGSTPTGRGIIAVAAAAGKRVQTEMGGHNPALVRADADLDQAVAAIGAGAFASAGQKCTSTRRVYVDERLYDAFVDQLVQYASALRVGAARDPRTELGPLAGSTQLAGVLDAVERASNVGDCRVGGSRVETEACVGGFFMAPTIFTDLPPESELATREVFGPVVSVWKLSDEDVLAVANRTEYGLSAAIFTRDLAWAQRFVEGVRAGIVHVNSQTAGAEAHVPFGGFGASSYGPHEQGRAAIEFFTQSKTVYIDPAPSRD